MVVELHHLFGDPDIDGFTGRSDAEADLFRFSGISILIVDASTVRGGTSHRQR
ncbi:MAG: hypothetical protein V9F00_08805 [Nocardioides sp.]